MEELDSTMALLSSELKCGGEYNSALIKEAKNKMKKPTVHVDSEEDEIFFGEKTDKEKFGKNSKFTRRETLHLGRAFPKRSIQPTPTKSKVWMDYRVKEDSLDEDSMSSSKLSPTELSKNVDDHENEENIDPKSTEGQGVLQEPVVEKEMEARPSPRVLIKPRESWVKKVVSKDSIDSKESISSPEKQIVFPSMTNQNVDNAPVKPSPRKINEAKAMANLSPSEIKTPPRKILHDDHESSEEEKSIIDIGNDQIFEDSIYTEYDAGDVSMISNKMSKKWRKRWENEDAPRKTFTTDTIDRLVAKQKSLLSDEKDEDENLMVINSPLSKPDTQEEDLNNLSTCSDWFNTTRDEMILFEKFGEDYDEVVNKMSHQEKATLRKEVDKCVPKSAEELLGLDQLNEDQDIIQYSQAENPLILVSRPPKSEEKQLRSPVPKPRTMTPKKDSPPKTPSMPMNQFPTSTPSTMKKLFKSPGSINNTPNYARPTEASKSRVSPRKKNWACSPKHEIDVLTSCPRAGFITSPDFSSKPKSLKRVAFASSVDLNKVISPVGQYIRSNPVPPIMRQIRPKNIKGLDDDLAAFERDEEMCKSSPPEKIEKKRMFKPIPRAEYTSSRVAFEQPVSSPNNGDEIATLPKVFGMAPTVQATVVRHIGRQKISKNSEFLQQNSPNNGNLIFKKPDPTRDSIMPDTTTDYMDMSIREVVDIKKMTSSNTK